MRFLLQHEGGAAADMTYEVWNEDHDDGTRWLTAAQLEKLIAEAVREAVPSLSKFLTAEELEAFERFCETCEDDEGYDVPKPMMKRLAAIGVIRRCWGNWYETTDIGSALHAERIEATRPLPPRSPDHA